MNVRQRIMVIGGIAGALLGVSAAYLYLRSIPIEVDEEGQERLPSIQPGKALAVSLLNAAGGVGVGERGEAGLCPGLLVTVPSLIGLVL
jgi:hypothetical protein